MFHSRKEPTRPRGVAARVVCRLTVAKQLPVQQAGLTHGPALGQVQLPGLPGAPRLPAAEEGADDHLDELVQDGLVGLVAVDQAAPAVEEVGPQVLDQLVEVLAHVGVVLAAVDQLPSLGGPTEKGYVWSCVQIKKKKNKNKDFVCSMMYLYRVQHVIP